MSKAVPDWVVVARGAVEARNVLRGDVIPAADELVRMAPNEATRAAAVRLRDAVTGACVKLTLGLKGRLRA